MSHSAITYDLYKWSVDQWVWFGSTNGQQGLRMSHQYIGQEVRGHELGESVSDGIIQGANGFVEFTAQEWDRCPVKEMSWQMSECQGALPVNGCTWRDVAANHPIKAERSTVQTYGETPGSATGVEPPCVTAPGDCGGAPKNPFAYIFFLPILDVNSTIQWAFNNDLKVVPFRFRLLPFKTAGQTNVDQTCPYRFWQEYPGIDDDLWTPA